MAFNTLIATAELAEHLDDPSWTMFDCRFSLADPAAGERAYRQGHIPAAHYAHLERDLSAPVSAGTGRHPLPEREALCAKLSAWGVRDNGQVVAYDDAGGVFAARMWWLLRWLGHERTAVLDGGWRRWLEEKRPIATNEAQRQPTVFAIRPSSMTWMTSEEVQAALARRAVRLVDARAPERFRGEVEPIDLVAGHVPGALNHPFQDNLAPDGRFLPADELRRRFARRLGQVRPGQVVHMCGSGVTACHNLLAMEEAGLTGSRLYAGSWSEWIRDAKRPVATGPARQ